MNLLMLGVNFRSAPIDIREKLVCRNNSLVTSLETLQREFNCEAVILGTCNRMEIYLARGDDLPLPDSNSISELLGKLHGLMAGTLTSHLVVLRESEAIHHLFRVVASLDSLVLGEGQIAGQVKHSYESAREKGGPGPVLNRLFQWARQVARRVRTETGLSRGHVSISSVAVDYVREVFDHFADKTIAVLGAGKMGELTLRHLKILQPKRILISNRSPDKAIALAAEHGGHAIPWSELDIVLTKADIILSTTGSIDPIVTKETWQRISKQRKKGRCVILDIAVPRDFDPEIHDGDAVCLFNIDDLKNVRNATLMERRGHIQPAEAIVKQEVKNFVSDWSRRKHGNAIAKLTKEFEVKRSVIVKHLLGRLNGRLTLDDKQYIEGAFRLMQNQFLHGPIAALAEEAAKGAGEENHTLHEALRKLFRLSEN